MTVAGRRALIDPSLDIPIVRQAEILGIARASAYYTPRVDPEDKRIMDAMDAIYTELPFYGVLRMRLELNDRLGLSLGPDRVRSLMRTMGLEAIYAKPRRNTSLSAPEHEKYPYLLRGMTAQRPNHIWGTDITYIRLAEGFSYLVALLDWHSRYVVAWALSPSLESTFCVENLGHALRSAIPDYHNSDQGVQFTGKEYLSILKTHPSIRISMDGRGRCMDNIFTERLWRTVKYEDVYLRSYADISAAREGLGNYFDFYNHRRRHQALDYRTPSAVYHGN
jgi:putative transposase